MIKKSTKNASVPALPGDVLYTPFAMVGSYLRKKDAPYAVKVVFVGINNDTNSGGGFVNVEYSSGNMWQFNFNQFGKDVFLKKEDVTTKSKEQEELDYDER